MSTGKFFLITYSAIILFIILDKIHFPFGIFFFTVLSSALGLIIWMPESLHTSLVNVMINPDNMERKREWRLMIAYLILSAHRLFCGFLTRYYPFSKFHQDRLHHAANHSLKKFKEELEQFTVDIHLPLYITGGDMTESMTYLSAVQSRESKLKKKQFLSDLQVKLQEKYISIYISPRSRGFTICVPTVMIEKQEE